MKATLRCAGSTCRGSKLAQSGYAGSLMCWVLAFLRFMDRAKVTANVVDIDSDVQTVLHAADVSELGDGTVEVMLSSVAVMAGNWVPHIQPLQCLHQASAR